MIKVQKITLFLFEPINNLNWSIAIEVNEDEYVVGFKNLASKFWLAIILIIFMLLLMGVHLSLKITSPIFKSYSRCPKNS